MSKAILLTAATEDSGEILELWAGKEFKLLHFPLERYEVVEDKTDIRETFRQLAEFENIIYGNLRNARYFMEQVKLLNKTETVQKRLNLTLDEETAAYLENEGIPAVCTYAGGKSINLVEFMLRLRRMGPVLYPCGSHYKEEIPGFLVELDISVKELELFELKGPEEEDLEFYKRELAQRQPDIILFHSRRAATRTLAAFPELDYKSARIISADKGITKKLKEKGLSVDAEADGNWKSIVELL